MSARAWDVLKVIGIWEERTRPRTTEEEINRLAGELEISPQRLVGLRVKYQSDLSLLKHLRNWHADGRDVTRLLGKQLDYSEHPIGAISTQEVGECGVEIEPEAVPRSYDNVLKMQARERSAQHLQGARIEKSEAEARENAKRVSARLKALMIQEVRAGRDPAILLAKIERELRAHEHQSDLAA